MGRVFCVLVLAALLSSTAFAQDQKPAAPAKTKPVQIAFFQLEIAGVEQKVSTIVSDAILAELSKVPDTKVIGSREIDALLSFEQKKQMTGCTDTACMVALGGALGVDKILTGNIGRLGESHVFNIKLLDVRSATMEQLYNKRLKGGNEEAFLDLVPEALAAIFPAHASLWAKKDSAPIAAVKQGQSAGTSISTYMPWVLIGTGGAALITGGVMHALAAKDYDTYKSLPESDPTIKDTWRSVNTKASAAYALYGIGVLAAGGGLAWYLLAAPAPKQGGSTGTRSVSFVPLTGPSVGGTLVGSW